MIAEIQKAIQTNNWPSGLNNQYFVFLSKEINLCPGAISNWWTCSDSTECLNSWSWFWIPGGEVSSHSCDINWNPCAYRSWYNAGNGAIAYDIIPHAMINVDACRIAQTPNGEPWAESAVNAVSYTSNAMLSDPLLDGWYDVYGLRSFQKCGKNFGTQLGGAFGSQFNQNINNHHYELQTEWSNATGQCVLTNK